MSRMCRANNSHTGIEMITGNTTDIREWLDFEFCDIIEYWDVPSTDKNPKIGRCLRVLHMVGLAMSYWILTSTGQIISRTMVQHLTFTEENKAYTA